MPNESKGNPKYSVFFFGTHESAFVKSTDICDYFNNLNTYCIQRKLNGFQKALDEIKEAAQKKKKRGPRKESGSVQRQQRNRIPNRLISNEDFVVPQPKKFKLEKPDISLNVNMQPTSPRKRTDSNSSNEPGRRRKGLSFSERFGVDLSDIETTYPNAIKNNVFPGLGSILEGVNLLESEQSEDDIGRFAGGRRRRRTRSRLFDDYLLTGKGIRDRSGSFSSNNGRTR